MKNSQGKSVDIKTLFELCYIVHTAQDNTINKALAQCKYYILKSYNAQDDYSGVVLKSIAQDVMIIIHKAADYNNPSYSFLNYNKDMSYSSIDICGISTTRVEHALKLVRSVISQYKDTHVIQFGYSEAGFVAEYVYGALDSNIDSIMVDSPGALELLQKTRPNSKYLQKKGEFQYYCTEPNAFNTVGEHIVPIDSKYYLINIKGKYDYGIGFIDYLNFSIKRHDFETLRKYISNPDNISLISPEKWPVSIVEGYEYYISGSNAEYLEQMVRHKIFPLIAKNTKLTVSSIQECSKLYSFFEERYLIKNTDTINPKTCLVEATTNFDDIAKAYLETVNPSNSSITDVVYKIIAVSYYCCCCCIALPVKCIELLFCNKTTPKATMVKQGNFIPLSKILDNLDNLEYSDGKMKPIDNEIFSKDLAGDCYLSVQEGGSHES
jgi:hypothetical protein